MKKKRESKKQEIGRAVEESGSILINPKSTPEDRRDALARVDAFNNAQASHAVRMYSETIGQSPQGSPEMNAIEQLSQMLAKDREQDARVSKLRSLSEKE